MDLEEMLKAVRKSKDATVTLDKEFFIELLLQVSELTKPVKVLDINETGPWYSSLSSDLVNINADRLLKARHIEGDVAVDASELRGIISKLRSYESRAIKLKEKVSETKIKVKKTDTAVNLYDNLYEYFTETQEPIKYKISLRG